MKIAVLTSGGVDSSVALKLLYDQRHDLTAFYLKIWLEDELAYLGNCPWEEDLKYVREICDRWQIPLQVISLQKEYQDIIVKYTLSEIKAGRTPNPDILCNKHIKFGLFYDCIDRSFDKIATGHYAQVEEVSQVASLPCGISFASSLMAGFHRVNKVCQGRRSKGRERELARVSKEKREKGKGKEVEEIKEKGFYLKRSPDMIKDQTYFLSHLKQNQLKRALFPIGHLTKKEVRSLAKKFDLPNQSRKDSQGLCFLGKIKFREFIKHHLKEKTGEIREKETGRKLGNHDGYWYYTIGQRHGIKLSGGPWFVVGKDTKNNIIYISHQNNLQVQAKNIFTVTNFNWIPYVETQNFASLQVKIRHGEKVHHGEIKFLNDKQIKVTLSEKDPGIAPGQFAVFYKGEYCLGGGVIEEI